MLSSDRVGHDRCNKPVVSSSSSSLIPPVSSSFGRLKAPAIHASDQTPKNANCPQNATSPKKGNAKVIRLINVEPTAGVQTSSALAEAVHAKMRSGCFEQSRTSPK